MPTDFAAQNPLSGRVLLQVIEFRLRVLEDFGRLIAREWPVTKRRRLRWASLRQKPASSGIYNQLKLQGRIG